MRGVQGTGEGGRGRATEEDLGRAHTWVSARDERKGGRGSTRYMRLALTREGAPSPSHKGQPLGVPAEPLRWLCTKPPTSPEGVHIALMGDGRGCSGPSPHTLPVFKGSKVSIQPECCPNSHPVLKAISCSTRGQDQALKYHPKGYVSRLGRALAQCITPA